MFSKLVHGESSSKSQTESTETAMDEFVMVTQRTSFGGLRRMFVEELSVLTGLRKLMGMTAVTGVVDIGGEGCLKEQVEAVLKLHTAVAEAGGSVSGTDTCELEG